MVSKTILLLSTATLGVFLGTQLAEAALIVPYWKGLSPDDFFAFYKTYGQGLYQFYSPLTIAATVLPILTLTWNLLTKQKIDFFMWTMVVFTLLFFASFFVYFKEANLSFTERTISNELLPNKLVEWGNWHWGRVICEGVAFASALVLLMRLKPQP
ncbi:MAG: hypothetical protein ACKOE6_07915 [Flammeovirgaceae bacterium]